MSSVPKMTGALPPAPDEDADVAATVQLSELGETLGSVDQWSPGQCETTYATGRRIRKAPTMDEQERPPEDDE